MATVTKMRRRAACFFVFLSVSVSDNSEKISFVKHSLRMISE